MPLLRPNVCRFVPALLFFLICINVLWGQSKAVELYTQGEAARNSGKSELAMELYKASLQENPNYREPYLRLAEIAFYEGSSEEALAYADTAAKLGKEACDVDVLRGRILTDLGRFTEAQELLSTVLSKQPNLVSAYRAMGELEIARGSLRRALVWYDRALNIDPVNRIALLSSVPVTDALEQWNDSEQVLLRAVELYPESFFVHLTAARHYLEINDLSRAEYHCDVALRIEPENRDALLFYALVLSRQGRYEDLLNRLNSGDSKGSSASLLDDYLGYYLKGSAQKALGRYPEALDSFSAVLRLRPEDQISRIVYEQILSSEVDRSLDENTKRIDEAVLYHLTLADRYRGRNRTDSAMREVRRALKLDPDSFSARRMYADLWLLKGFPAKQLSILEVLERQGKLDTSTSDTLEVYRHELNQSVSERWNIDQFSLDRFRYQIPVYISGERGSMLHSLSKNELASYVAHVMNGYEKLSVPEAAEVGSFAEAYGRARALSAHYFALIVLSEDERSFTLDSELYGGSTGALIERQRIYRTGNERVTDAIGIWVDRLDTDLPALGKMLRYSFASGLMDLGTIDGVENDEAFMILPKDKLAVRKEGLGLRFEASDAVGTFTVTSRDEMVSEGDVASNRFYDLINPGDWVVKKPDADSSPPPKDSVQSSSQPLSHTDVYKSVSGIR
ncbi:tetratricopeptide repeat protein [Sediminispirochaeta smaragdinae]|uniref:Tetratricopeptide TPR_2 repeat protein n=1 Tax=Sediminispirochaeta smaragdinae (strain DSM 11293 / JCM 15392 / SEBR 4228) TaxID=573413 RepID=E1R3C9_SEDSS|nr:tetratricopeptide repeat protein [Sediminispirochaeta smaragdinae]ADK81560.1 Tetratricopeptide TPR_2 repeat protein [Sediminispirochaeta smaragdinae DSM 11293]